MSELNKIDDLFRSGLESEANVAYQPSAWLGAEQQLNRHFRLLFLKKAVLIAVPVLLMLGGGLWYMTEEPTTVDLEVAVQPTSTTVSSEIATVESTTERVVSTNASAQTETVAAESTPSITFEEAKPEPTMTKKNAVLKKPATPDVVSASTEPKTTKEEPNGEQLMLADQQAKTIETKAEAINKFLGMPTFKVGRLGESNEMFLAEEDFVQPQERIMNQFRKFELGVHGGVALVNGLENVDPSEKTIGLGTFIGFSSKYHINPKLFISLSATMSVRNNLASKNLDQLTLMGWRGTDADRLTFADIPLQFGYNLGIRHSLAFGMAFSPLIGYRQWFIDQDVVSGGPDNPTETREVQPGLHRKGFANFDVAPMLTYRFQVTRQIDVMAEARFGLFDVTDNTYFGTNLVDDRNHQLRIGLNYSLTRR